MSSNKLIIFASIFIVSLSVPVYANEMPLKGFPASGIVVRDERNIQIKKEELRINHNNITVMYIFHNYSDKEIVTDVAFPIPPHNYEPSGRIKYPLHGDFKVVVNGKETEYQEKTRALIANKDLTTVLEGLNISIKDFDQTRRGGLVYGHYFNRLSKSRQKELIDLGAVRQDNDDPSDVFYLPAWSVETTYYWTQTFPAKSDISISHTYSPNESTDRYYLHEGKAHSLSKKAYTLTELSQLHCLTKEQAKLLTKAKSAINLSTIDYILTTANHWKQPVKEFHLVIGPDVFTEDHDSLVSTCFEKDKLSKISDKYEIMIKDFVPKEEIKVYFLTYPK